MKDWMKWGLAGGLIFTLLGVITAIPENNNYSNPIYLLLDFSAYISDCSSSIGLTSIPCELGYGIPLNFIFGFILANIISHIKK
ncbi:hypothetical protein L6303_02680 [archaeon]|nr:hypothetical protein [Nanoarchaeota archaeon]MBU4299858.1 hypothetical protein [Nanoarchaeota archaeon]MCG2723625.1 hypothetical protein [archaeon]